MMGMALGLTSGSRTVDRSMANVAEGVISTAKTTLGNVPNLLDGLMDMDPVIAGPRSVQRGTGRPVSWPA
jgi:hypothetical protein